MTTDIKPGIVLGDIFKAKADAIVNPANGFLRNGAGLARMIEQGAGAEYVRECRKVPTISTGDAVLTTAGNLPFQGVINAVGPVWSGGKFGEAFLLYETMVSVQRVAHEAGLASVACPAISCGLFRFPVDRAAVLLVAGSIAARPRYPVEVTFYVLTGEHYDAFTVAGACPSL